MKKTVLCTAGVLALATMGYVGSRLGAQGTAPAAAASSGRGTHIAVMNLAYVIKNYEKFKAFEVEMKSNLKQFDDRLALKRGQLEGLTKEAQGPATTAARKEELEKNARGLQREMEDIQNEGKAYISKKRDEQIVQLYREVQDAASRYAMSQGIDLVLHYTDATTPEDYINPVNVARKMQSPGCMPLYWSQSVDISREITTTLNTAYHGAAAAPSVTGNGPQR